MRGPHSRPGHTPGGRGPGVRQPRGPAGERILVLFIAGVVALNYPLLALIGHHAGSPPVLWIGLFGFWAVFIFAIHRLHRGTRRGRDHG